MDRVQAQIGTLDIAVIAAYLAIVLLIGIWVARRTLTGESQLTCICAMKLSSYNNVRYATSDGCPSTCTTPVHDTDTGRFGTHAMMIDRS